MTTRLRSAEDLKDNYWYPYNPNMRWLIVLFGVAGIGYSIWDYIQGLEFNFGRFAQGVFFLSASFIKPQLRPKNWVTKTAHFLVVALIVCFLVGGIWLSCYKPS
jgi:hypothetical protein